MTSPLLYQPVTTLDRWGLASDIAYAGLYLASDESANVTGVILPVDRGYLIGY